jgi:hypothetical protein
MRHLVSPHIPSAAATTEQGAELQHGWMPLGRQMGLLMLLRGIDCLGQHSAGADARKVNAAAYCDVGLSALQADDGVLRGTLLQCVPDPCSAEFLQP